MENTSAASDNLIMATVCHDRGIHIDKVASTELAYNERRIYRPT